MFSDEETKEGSYIRAGDEILSIHEVCLDDKYDKKELGLSSEPLLSNSGKNDLFRKAFFSESLEPQQAKFAWTEDDGNIVPLESEFESTVFGNDLDVSFKNEEDSDDADVPTSSFESITRNGYTFATKPYEPQSVTSTSTDNTGRRGRIKYKVDKADPRSRFHYVKYVKRHGRSIKLWECGICCREFQHQYTLMRHLPTHTDERNFHCATCGKSFRQLSTLSQHRAIHSSERPYSCEVCQKTFNRVSTLISHRKTHSKEKPYRCHICPKGFHQKGNLRNHLFTHTNQRPYRCNICNKGFNQQSNLVCHKNKVHQTPSINCLHQGRSRNFSITMPTSSEGQPDSTSAQVSYNEVSSSVGPYLPSMDGLSSSTWPTSSYWDPKADAESHLGSGVIVDAIKTYHMGVAIATKQTPFALLKPDNGSPVLVKVVDTNLPGGKQMLVPATAADLRIGGKIIVKNKSNTPVNVPSSGAVQIRVPVVATVVPKIRGGRLQLVVEEPHRAFQTALSTDAVKPSSCVLPPPSASPSLDMISLDLFEPMECNPLGPQVTAVDMSNIEETVQSDDPDFGTAEFEVKSIMEF